MSQQEFEDYIRRATDDALFLRERAEAAEKQRDKYAAGIHALVSERGHWASLVNRLANIVIDGEISSNDLDLANDAITKALPFLADYDEAVDGWVEKGKNDAARWLGIPDSNGKTKVSEPDKPAIPWCEEHQCEFVLVDRDPPGYEFYACPECERDRGEALDLR